MRVGIVGSRKYQDKRKVKDFIYELKKKFQDELVIISGGCKDGADYLAKKYALELDVQYQEYPPFHHPYNLYCVLPEELFARAYKVSYFFVRNKQIARASDMVVGFIPEGIISNGTNSTLKYAEKFKKKTIILS